MELYLCIIRLYWPRGHFVISVASRNTRMYRIRIVLDGDLRACNFALVAIESHLTAHYDGVVDARHLVISHHVRHHEQSRYTRPHQLPKLQTPDFRRKKSHHQCLKSSNRLRSTMHAVAGPDPGPSSDTDESGLVDNRQND